MQITKELCYAIALINIPIGGLAQVLLKKSAIQEHSSILKQYINVKVISAYAMFFATTIMSPIALRILPLKITPIFDAIGYIIVPLMGYIFFKDHITKKYLVGVIFIFFGIIIFYYQ